MHSYRCVALGNLAAQLQRSPSRLRLKQLLGIDFVLSVLEDDRQYPFDFIVHAITSFRPRPSADGGDTQLFSAEAIRNDLVLMAEEISGDADIDAQSWGEPVFTVPDLAERFSVSTKTIFRWHHRGLVGWRFRFPDKRQRLAFTERAIRRFVSSNLDLVQRGSSFSQLSTAERDGIVERARQLVEEGHRTVNAVAKVIANETNRAVETIRLILKHYDDGLPGAGIFNRSNLRVAADDLRLKIWEAYSAGATVQQLVEKFDQTLPEIRKTITEMRARELKARTIEFVPAESFAEPGTEMLVREDPAAAAPYGELPALKRVPADLPPYLQQLFRIPLLSPAGEVALFRKLNFLRYKADKLRNEMEPETVEACTLDEIEALITEANNVKNQIAQSNLRLVVSIAKRHVAPTQEFFELVSDGNISLMRAVDKFDFNRGFKFSTYASWAIMKNFARTVPESKHHRDRYQTGRDEFLESAAGAWPADAQETDFLPAVRATVEKMLGVLDEREQQIMRHRYGLDTNGEPQTLEQIGKLLGVSKERVRQIEARAMPKLRDEFAGAVKQLLGN
ncbi:MAG: sigma-70 family RNA polymerase sigma factor [Phycisphaerae bacterium]